MDNQLLREFLAEAEDLIEELHDDIAALRAQGSRGRARRELVARIFRRVHTIKGTASASGLAMTSRIAHELEALLDAVRLGRMPLDDAALDAGEDSVAAIAASLDAVAKGEPESSPDELIERLRRLASSGVEATRTGEADAEELLPAEVARALGEYERQRLREAVREGAQLYVVAASFGLETFDQEFRRLSDALSELGEVVAAQPTLDAETPERVGFRIIYASAEARESLSERATQLGARLWRERKSEFVDEGARAEEAGDEESVLRRGGFAPAPFVRVPLDLLDDIISATRELSADASSMLALAFRLSESGGDAREELDARAARLHSRFFELEAQLIKLRTVPARATLERAARAGRSAARASGKLVEFEIEGGDVRLAKPLADALADPLLHLVRNAVAHGIETPQERRAAGKAELGRVRIEALAEGEHLVLRVSDDGRGVDAGLISESASERGIIAPGAVLSDEQALKLIFRPGFSTTARASLVSGRGVGLDVVERLVEDAGGQVSVQSERGRGATFELRLPSGLVRETRD